MKKYSSITKRNSRLSATRVWRRAFAATIAVLLVGWLFPYAMSFVSYVALAPIEAVSSWYRYSEATLPLYLRSRTELTKQITELEQALANRTGTNLSVDRLLAENMQLRAMAEIGEQNKRVAARVIAQPTTLAYDLLQIDKGSDAGVVVGAPVFFGVDTVIGVVVHTAPQYAFVELVTTPGFNATAYVIGPNIFAPIEGVGGGVARVRVPQGIVMREGNLVLLPSVSGGVYGEIVSIENVPAQPEQYGYVTPPVSLQSMLYVSVGTEVLQVRDVVEIEESLRQSVREYFRLDTIPNLPDLVSATTSTSTEGVEEVVPLAE